MAVRILMLLVSFQIGLAGTQRAVIIGISTYRDLPENLWLDFAHSDGRSFSDLLKSPHVNVPPENVTTLLNEEATTVNVRTAFGKLLKEATEEDIVYVYVACHGTVDRDLNAAFFVTYDTDPKNLYGTAYPMSEFQMIYKKLKAKHLIVISDACKSGSIGADITGTRRDIGEDEVVVNQHIRDILQENKQVGDSQFIYAAAGARESSIEDPNVGAGIFTKHLIDGLKGRADDDSNGLITASEIHNYVFTHVRRDTSGRQNPMIVNDAQFDGELVLSITSPKGPAAKAEPAITGDLRRLEHAPEPTSPAPASRTEARPGPSLSAGFGTLVLESSVEGVEIYVDGSRVVTLGPTPTTLAIPAGSRHLTARKSEYETLEERITVLPNQQLQKKISLRPLFDPAVKALEQKFLEAAGLPEAERSKAIKTFKEVLTTLVEWGQQRRLSSDEQSYLYDSFIYYLNALLEKKSVAAIHAAVEDCFKVSPILPAATEFNEPELYRDLVASRAAILSIQPKVKEVQLDIDGLFRMTISSQESLFVRPGAHHVRLSKPNYVPLSAELDLQAGTPPAPLVFEANLERLQLLILTADQISAGVTSAGLIFTRPVNLVFGSLSSKVQMALRKVAESHGLDLEKLYLAYFDRVAPSLEELRLEFSQPGFESKVFQARLVADQMDDIHELDGFFIADQVIKLQPIVGHLVVNSKPEGAAVLLKGNQVGVTPFDSDLLAGEYDLKLKHPTAGSYVERILVEKDKTRTVSAELKPTLTYLGILPGRDVPKEKLADVNERLETQIRNQVSLYFFDPQPAAKYEFWDQLLEEVQDGVDGEEVKKLQQRLQLISQRYDSQLVLFGAYGSVNDYLAHNLTLYLMHANNPKPNEWKLNSRNLAELAEIASTINKAEALERRFFKNWIGLKALDTVVPNHELVVLEVFPDSPAARAQIHQGDVIELVDGQEMDALGLRKHVDSRPVHSEIQIQIQTQAASVRLKVEPIPAILDDPNLFNNSSLFQLHNILAQHPKNSPLHDVALLNIGIIHMSFENWRLAIENLNRLESEIIPQGFVSYLLGRCFESLGEKQQAQTYYREAQLYQQEFPGMEFYQQAAWRLRALQ